MKTAATRYRHAAALRRALLGLLLAGAGVLAAAAGRGYVDTAERLLEAANAGHAQADSTLRDTAAALEELRRLQPALQVLTQRQLIGDEQRLVWLERLDALSRPLTGYGMSWQFMPRRPIDPAILDAEAGTLEVTGSRQTLDLSIRHEGQLLDLLDALIDSVPALVRIERCSLSRDTGDARGGLSAQCTLDWITFRPRVPP